MKLSLKLVSRILHACPECNQVAGCVSVLLRWGTLSSELTAGPCLLPARARVRVWPRVSPLGFGIQRWHLIEAINLFKLLKKLTPLLIRFLCHGALRG